MERIDSASLETTNVPNANKSTRDSSLNNESEPDHSCAPQEGNCNYGL